MNLATRDRREQAAQHRDRALALLPELADRQVPRRRLHHRLFGLVAGLLALALVAGVFGGFWAYRRWQQQVGSQQTTAVPALAPADLTAYTASEKSAAAAPAGTGIAPIVLTYHDIGPNTGGSRYVVTPQEFAAQMEMLHQAGYRTLTAQEFLRYRAGGSVPPRSVLITFDDGTRGLWTYADQVLARYGFTAVSFLITGQVGTHAPYYLTWPQVERMERSGRWDFESHTHDLHTKIVGPDGQDASTLTARLPVAGGGRESLAAFRARITADLQQSLRDFAAHGLPRPQLFAWPFSDVVGDQSDPPAAAAATAVVHQLFKTAFVDVGRPLPATRAEVADGTVQRLELFADDTDRTLFDRMRHLQTLPVQDLRPTRVDSRWLEKGGYPAPIDVNRLADDVVTVDADTMTYLLADWAPQRTSGWRSYTVSGTLVVPSGAGTTGLRARVGSADEVSVRLSHNTATLLVGSTVRATRNVVEAGAPGPRHQLQITVTPQHTRVVLDGTVLADLALPADGPVGALGVVFSRASAGGDWGSVQGLRVRPAS
ncbi:MAG TPA: polysaccharide deacetylase family protein [Motilibacteraceae bacterium]|nr:polysaccharide deacetylase family protein [Motilibacteraceae bacterium]